MINILLNMNRVTFDSKSYLKTDSFRSIATHTAARSVYISRSTRNLRSSKLSLNSINPRVTVDYLGLISPKSDKIEIVEPIESKDSILESHNIKELISIQEQKRTVIFTKEIFSNSNLSDSSTSETFSSLSKLLSHFRTIEAKV